jgi:hypothetical protein
MDDHAFDWILPGHDYHDPLRLLKNNITQVLVILFILPPFAKISKVNQPWALNTRVTLDFWSRFF